MDEKIGEKIFERRPSRFWGGSKGGVGVCAHTESAYLCGFAYITGVINLLFCIFMRLWVYFAHLKPAPPLKHYLTFGSLKIKVS